MTISAQDQSSQLIGDRLCRHHGSVRTHLVIDQYVPRNGCRVIFANTQHIVLRQRGIIGHRQHNLSTGDGTGIVLSLNADRNRQWVSAIVQSTVQIHGIAAAIGGQGHCHNHSAIHATGQGETIVAHGPDQRLASRGQRRLCLDGKETDRAGGAAKIHIQITLHRRRALTGLAPIDQIGIQLIAGTQITF